MAVTRKSKTGDRHGRLVIVAAYTEKGKHGWLHQVKCDCGTIKAVLGKSLYRGHSQSCGCLQVERSTKHGKTKSAEYKAWCAMITRCTNEKQPGFKNYGGRGISVCERWREFENFLLDMGKKPTTKHTLERVNNDVGYWPDNCIWADRFTQSQNQRTRVDNKTGYKGVSFDKAKQKYITHIQKDGERTYLGQYDDLHSAIKARRNAEMLIK